MAKQPNGLRETLDLTFKSSDLFKVLIVDDDQTNLKSLGGFFEQQGYNVDGSDSLSKARELIENNKYDLIILDVVFKNPNEHPGDFILSNRLKLGDSKIVGLSLDNSKIPDALKDSDVEIVKKTELKTLDDIVNRIYSEKSLEFIEKLRDTMNPDQIDGKKRTSDTLILEVNQQPRIETSAADSNQKSDNLPSSDPTLTTARIQFSESDGISPHIASDLWTVDDALGYDNYAYAISKFLTHAKTKPPLTISIQAPWGGGKTSLMRMIRNLIDPEADIHAKEAILDPKGELILKEALTEIKSWIDNKTNRKPIEPEDNKKLEGKNKETNNLSVWFNAWKYENTNQVWAGLIDAIMQQVAVRLPVRERELFWLRLHLKRVDTDKIRRKVNERIFNYFLHGLYKSGWLLGVSLLFLIAGIVIWAMFSASYAFIAGTGLSATTVLTACGVIWKSAKTKVENEPAAVSLNDYLEIPDYRAEYGFVHQAEMDLKHVLESINEEFKPLVIFIDDLDRCSPTKISQVVEAVNLFLAGNFPDCIFIIGMDTEMVAAAMQTAHKEIVASLPTDLGVPVGWRFMDKFVQLPFLIPPSQRYTKDYIDSLFASDDGETKNHSKESRIKRDSLIQRRFPQLPPYSSVEEAIQKLANEKEVSEEDIPDFVKDLRRRVSRETIDEGIKNFTDKNKEIRTLMDKQNVFAYFTGNPREVKRFVNAFRFNYFLWWALKSQGSADVSIEQLLRWTVFSMRWPEVVRFLRRGGGSEWRSTQSTSKAKSIVRDNLVKRFSLLEEISNIAIQAKDTATDFKSWQTKVADCFSLKLENTNWLNDEDLFHFFAKEFAIKKGKRLSDGIDKGLW